MVRPLKPDLAITEIITEPDRYKSELTEAIQQALSRLLLFDPERQLFRLWRGDISGRAFVSNAFPNNVSITSTLITGSGITAEVIKPNEKRLRFSIQNRTNSTMQVSYESTVTGQGQIELVPGETLIDDEYRGVVSIITGVFVGHVYVMDIVER